MRLNPVQLHHSSYNPANSSTALQSHLSTAAYQFEPENPIPRDKMSSFLLFRALPARTSALRAFSTSTRQSSFAKISLIGRLADTPELQATSTGHEILKYAVATSSGPRDNQKTSWFKVVSFLPEGPQRDFIAGLDKGYVCILGI